MSAHSPLPVTSAAPDFRHVESWIFDLDHTLYTVEPMIRRAVEERICLFVQRHLGLPRDEAHVLQKTYLREYGITLAGLMKHHGVDPDRYHDEINDIEVLALAPDPDLRRALERLPGRRYVFTNNCGRFARCVLERLVVQDLFDGIWDIHAVGFVPKPNLAAYDTIVRSGALAPARSAMFEDTARNLAPAHALGMTTVWLNGWGLAEFHAHVHHETDDLAGFLHKIRV